ncbi:MAG: membrane-bound dehydrogenase domain-containing protein [Limisphaerales bacterium]|nr:MAG: membrane-bound dehydrogenase domain-containing protein [Limisphaerales bacterium]KAG0506809.1 MAG: membrane-bound dehydrogenase domain-containing protein [Limisphaerales bacterium]TXT45514.1 MAG: membrane-bound dehydrogenase domain-containing protein [Limisphaerales bacterium]
MKLSFSTAATLLVALTTRGADFPQPFNSEPDTNFAALPAAQVAAQMKLPPGFKATVFAAEPDVQNPIALAWDARGRLWVAENYTYAERTRKFELRLRDRVLIFEDKDGDGRFDSRKVFTDDVQMLTSVEVGRGGVWLMCPPQLLFIPTANGGDTPTGPAEVVLDGFTPPAENYHNYANGLRFGPDGWLYGRCGASAPGEIGAPSTPKDARIPLRGTIWRYHPTRKVFEALSSGCTNPWGHDWDAHGELFFINTVNGHLWHGITGAHYVRPHTIDPNPRTYALIDQHADHWHFDTASDWTKSRDGAADALGGGHAHIGMMIYQGDNWPVEYRGRLFTLNMHGRRVNQEILERKGSGYVGKHGPDFLIATDKWFRGMELTYGPDGGVYVADWSDTGECHDSTGVHRTSGRIYKITHGEPKRPANTDLTKLSVPELVRLHTNANEWFARQARLQLIERAKVKDELASATTELRKLFANSKEVVHQLRVLWSLHALGAADEALLLVQLNHPDEHLRAWAVRLLTDTWPLDTVMSERPKSADLRSGAGSEPGGSVLKLLNQTATSDSSALVRLTLASALQRLPVSQYERANLASCLLSHQEDATDHNLPALIWYGLIPVADRHPDALLFLTEQCRLPLTRRLIARRLAEDIEKNPSPVNLLLAVSAGNSELFQTDILTGLGEGLAGWRKAKKPTTWDIFSKRIEHTTNTALRDRVRDLSVVFGDGRALDEVKRVALAKDGDMNARKAALQTLIESRPPDLRAVCEQLLGVRFLNTVAVRGLAQFDDPAIGEKLAKSYRSFHPSERPAVMDTLVSRPVFAKALLAEVAAGRLPRVDVSAFHARQIRSFNDAALNAQLAKAWGELREAAADKKALIAKLKTQLTSEVLAKADKSAGRALFTLACASCHRLYGQGGEVGPDLTGSGRDNLDYLLDNIADPSAVVSADFRMTVADLKDGRTLNALVAARTERTLTLKTMTETITVQRSDVTSLKESALSLMPEGLLEALTPEQQRDLIAYLMHKSQVPLPK